MKKTYILILITAISILVSCQEPKISRTDQITENNNLDELFKQDDGYQYTKVGIACKKIILLS